MKIAVLIPDDLFSRAEELAHKTGKSHSQIYKEALLEYLRKRDPRALVKAIDDALVGIDPKLDPWLIEAGHKALDRSEW